MAKFCSKCGSELSDNARFCNACGNPVNKNNNPTNTIFVPRREIVVSVILSIITCGIYGMYWFMVMTDDVNYLDDDKSTSGVLALVLSLLTCGIYHIYWSYKMGQRLKNIGNKYNVSISDNSIPYMLLSIFRLSIVNYCLIQNDLNKFSRQ